MKTEKIIKKIQSIPGGRFFRVRYITKVKLSAELEDAGYSIFKVVDTTTRTGVKYNKIKTVEPTSHPEDKEPRVSNWEWVVKDRIKHNTKTGKDYLVIAPIKKGAHSKSTFILTDPEGCTRIVDREEVKLFAIPSYWKEDKPAIMNVTLENILLVKQLSSIDTTINLPSNQGVQKFYYTSIIKMVNTLKIAL